MAQRTLLANDAERLRGRGLSVAGELGEPRHVQLDLKTEVPFSRSSFYGRNR